MSSPLQSPKIVLKPWGREIWYAEQAAYAGKVLEISAGKRLSLQYHERKTETLYLLSGRVIVTFRPLVAGETRNMSTRGRPGRLCISRFTPSTALRR
ncbi:MAG: hypothetical protein RJA48_982 [Verrucomicrobiota bacterium]